MGFGIVSTNGSCQKVSFVTLWLGLWLSEKPGIFGFCLRV